MAQIPDPVLALAARQAGVASRAQLLSGGVTGARAARWAAAGRWQRLLPGVYALHSGPVGWRSRAWAALLYAGAGAALSHEAAAHAHGFGDPPRVIDVIIPARRTVVGRPGIRLHRRRSMPALRGRLRVVERGATVVDLVERARTTADAVGVVTSAVRAGTRPGEIQAALRSRTRVRRRELLALLTAEVDAGVESPLEHEYHHRVERAHGLPAAKLQHRHRLGVGWIRADRLYEGLATRVELDGQLGHPGGRTDADTWRDNLVLIERRELTLRYRWRHVVATPCETAAQVVTALRAKGWRGRPRSCGPGCPVT